MNKRQRGILDALAPAVQFAMERAGKPRADVPGLAFKPRASADTAAELMIYGAIGGGGWFSEGISAADVAAFLKEAGPGPIDVRLNSGGGDVFDGVAMHSLLARHPGLVTVHVDGLAASAASFVMLAGDHIRSARNAFVMIHDAMTSPYGNSTTIRRAADLLDQVSDNIADMYAERAGEDAAYWRNLMTVNGEDGTWYTGQEALDAGLVDEITAMPDEDAGDGYSDRVSRLLDGWRGILPDAVAATIKPVDKPVDNSAPDWDAAKFLEIVKGTL